jgi:hypothetical protein
MQEELIARFPADVEGIKRFFHELETMIDAMRFPNRAANRSLLERAAKTSARDYLRGLITDWRLRRFLGSLGTREAYAGLPLLAATWNHMCEEGIWYPQGGMRSFCTRLAQAVAGWSWDFEDNSDYHPLGLVETPVFGLYMAGYQAYSAGGVHSRPAAKERQRRYCKVSGP